MLWTPETVTKMLEIIALQQIIPMHLPELEDNIFFTQMITEIVFQSYRQTTSELVGLYCKNLY